MRGKNSLELTFEEKTGQPFTTYYEKYRPKLQWFINGMLRDEDEAADITNITFITSLEKIDSYDPTKSVFSTWLFTIGKRLCIQRIRQKSRFTSIEEEHDGMSLSDSLVAEVNTDNPYLIDEKVAIIKEMIPHLPEKYRKVIRMRELEGETYKDISDELGINLSTIKSQIRQGRILLQKMTKKHFDLIEEQNEQF
jgi:RNA polymerase sigma-70 factor (ECF subfamily)